MANKSAITAVTVAAGAMLVAAPAQAHGTHHHRYASDPYSDCKIYHVPWNNGHDRIIVLSCPIAHNYHTSHRSNGHDKRSGAVK